MDAIELNPPYEVWEDISDGIRLSIEDADIWVAFERYYALCNFFWANDHTHTGVDNIVHKRYEANDGCVFSISVATTDVTYAYAVKFTYTRMVDGVYMGEHSWSFVMPVEWYNNQHIKADECRSSVEGRVLDENWFVPEFFEFMDDYEARP